MTDDNDTRTYTEEEEEKIRQMILDGCPQAWDPSDMPPWAGERTGEDKEG